MMRDLLNLFLSICLLGLFVAPADVLACDAHTATITQAVESCCEQSEASNKYMEADQEECCADPENKGSDCSSRCGTKSCHHASHSIGMQTSSKHGLNMYYSSLKKSYPLYQQSYFPSGIPSIWQPPKIG